MKRYFEEPYRFIRPYRGKFWCRSLQPVLPRVLRKAYQVHRWHFIGSEHLLQSARQNAGILLTPNHSGFADPPVMGMLGVHVGMYFFYMASWHLFKQSGWARFKMTRTGAFSVFREGVDRDALRESVQILANAERPLVVFPEGTWFRQNDRIGPLQEGVALITKRAVKESQRPIIVHPVSIKYWYLEDPRPAMREHLAKLESRIRWHPQRHLDLHQRITKLSEAFVTIKEIEYLGSANTGDLDWRISSLCNHVLERLETKYFRRVNPGSPMDRVRALLQVLVKRLQNTSNAEERLEVQEDLDHTFFCQVLFGHSQEYLSDWPTVERLAEAVKRLEEDLTGVEIQLGPMGVVVEVGEGIDVRNFQPTDQHGNHSLVTEIASRIQRSLDRQLDQGPPKEWNCITKPRSEDNHQPRSESPAPPLPNRLQFQSPTDGHTVDNMAPQQQHNE